MAINFGSSDTSGDLDKAMANLKKMADPIFQTTAKEGWGGTKSSTEIKPGDPGEAIRIRAMAEEQNARMRANTPTVAETLLGGVQGALSGMSAGGSVAGALGASDSGLGKAIGGVVGSFIGGSAFGSGGRASGMATMGALDNIAKGAAEWERATKVQIANDAVASFAQKMGEFSHPTNPKQAVEFAAQKDKIISGTAQALVASGVAPDKALQTAQAMAAIHDPSGRYSDAKTQAATALSEFYAGPQTAEDKAMLRNKLNTVILGESIRQGKLPANATSMLFGSGAGSTQPAAPGSQIASGGPASPMAPRGAAPSQGPVYGPQPAPKGVTYAGNSPGPWSPDAPQGGGGIIGTINKALGPFGSPMSGFPGAPSAEAATGPAATPSGGGAGAAPIAMPQPQPLVIPNKPTNAAEAKQAFGAQNAWNALDKAEALILSDVLPDSGIEAAQANFSKNGLDMAKVLGGAGTAIGGLMGTLGAGAGALPGAMIGGGIGGALGSGMGKVGEGASWGMSDEKEVGLGTASQIKAQLQTHIGQVLGSNAAGRSEDMKDIINSALGIQGDSIEERLAAIQTLRQMVQESANEIGAYSEEKPSKKGGNIAKVRAGKPGLFFFD